VCMCVFACVRACMCACVCVCVCMFSVISSHIDDNSFTQETEGILLCKMTEEMNHLKATVNDMSVLIYKIAENQNIDLKDTRN